MLIYLFQIFERFHILCYCIYLLVRFHLLLLTGIYFLISLHFDTLFATTRGGMVKCNSNDKYSQQYFIYVIYILFYLFLTIYFPLFDFAILIFFHFVSKILFVPSLFDFFYFAGSVNLKESDLTNWNDKFYAAIPLHWALFQSFPFYRIPSYLPQILFSRSGQRICDIMIMRILFRLRISVVRWDENRFTIMKYSQKIIISTDRLY